MSIVVIARIRPILEHREAVIGAFEQSIPRVHAEDEGCELYAMHEAKDELVMIEKWASAEALRAHGTSAAMLALGSQLAGKLAGAPEIEVVQPHPAGAAALGAI